MEYFVFDAIDCSGKDITYVGFFLNIVLDLPLNRMTDTRNDALMFYLNGFTIFDIVKYYTVLHSSSQN